MHGFVETVANSYRNAMHAFLDMRYAPHCSFVWPFTPNCAHSVSNVTEYGIFGRFFNSRLLTCRHARRRFRSRISCLQSLKCVCVCDFAFHFNSNNQITLDFSPK